MYPCLDSCLDGTSSAEDGEGNPCEHGRQAGLCTNRIGQAQDKEDKQRSPSLRFPAAQPWLEPKPSPEQPRHALGGASFYLRPDEVDELQIPPPVPSRCPWC